ncbi:MAG TPA: LapA family protein [Magnetospirillaceae bacterium]|nr:LapA family protein [Magnetospirillaceae bacterium]
MCIPTVTVTASPGATVNIGCCSGRSACRCNHGRSYRRFGLGFIGTFLLFCLRQWRRQRKTVRDLQARVVELEKQKAANLKSIIALIQQNTPACTATHEVRYIRSERLYFLTWVLGLIFAAFGAFGSAVLVNFFRSTTITDGTPLGWIATSIADSTAYAWLFGIAGTFVVTTIGMLIGYIIDRIANVRSEQELSGPVTR